MIINRLVCSGMFGSKQQRNVGNVGFPAGFFHRLKKELGPGLIKAPPRPCTGVHTRARLPLKLSLPSLTSDANDSRLLLRLHLQKQRSSPVTKKHEPGATCTILTLLQLHRSIWDQLTLIYHQSRETDRQIIKTLLYLNQIKVKNKKISLLTAEPETSLWFILRLKWKKEQIKDYFLCFYRDFKING